MKILHIIDSGGFYGAEAMILALALEQVNSGHQVTVCSIGTYSDKEKAIEKKLHENNIDVFKVRFRSGVNLLGGLTIIRYAVQNEYDLLHSHGYKGNILLGLLPLSIRKMPLVMTLHGTTVVHGLSKMKLYELVDRLFFRRMDAVIVVAKELLNREGIKGRYLKRLTVIPNGIPKEVTPIDAGNQVLAKIDEIKKRGRVVGSIGRLSDEKGYDILIRAFAKLVDIDPKLQLILMGDGQNREDLKLLAREEKVSDNIWFSGYVEDANLFISCFDAYVNSSYTEAMPITLLEAMRVECPIVATNVGGVPDLLKYGELGVLSDAGNIESLYRSVLLALTDVGLKNAFKAKSYFCNNLTSSVMSDRYIAIYSDVIGMDYNTKK